VTATKNPTAGLVTVVVGAGLTMAQHKHATVMAGRDRLAQNRGFAQRGHG